MNAIFNNREIAIGIWSCIFLAWGLRNVEVRESLKGVFSALLHKAIVLPFILMAIYVGFLVYFLFDVGLWNTSQLKNTILWFLFVAATSFFTINNINEDANYFKESLKSHIKIIVLLEFIVAFYNFSLLAELVIIPIATFLTALLVYAELKEEHQQVAKLLNNILAILGTLAIFYCFYQLTLNFGNFAKLETLMDFIIPVLLSVLLLPFIYFLSRYALYESILIRVNIYTDNKSYRRYAKFLSLVHFKWNHKALNKWLQYSCMSDFESKDSIRKSIENFNQQQT